MPKRKTSDAVPPEVGLLTLSDVVARTKVSEGLVRNWLESGALRSVKLGPHRRSPRRVREEDLAEFIRKHVSGDRPGGAERVA